MIRIVFINDETMLKELLATDRTLYMHINMCIILRFSEEEENQFASLCLKKQNRRSFVSAIVIVFNRF